MKFQFLFPVLIIVFNCTSCNNTPGSKEESSPLAIEEIESYQTKGPGITSKTFMALSGRLQKAMKAGGVQNAVKYCNTAAYPITDSLSKIYNVKIKRISENYRNPKNQPTDFERKILSGFKDNIKSGTLAKPVVKYLDNKNKAFFSPIFVNDLCLKCHGVIGGSLAEEDSHFIKTFYPNDKATGYLSGDLRGMWRVEFLKD